VQLFQPALLSASPKVPLMESRGNYSTNLCRALPGQRKLFRRHRIDKLRLKAAGFMG
jgi:hypothetical protein